MLAATQEAGVSIHAPSEAYYLCDYSRQLC